jgi:hypothetical protein
LLTYVAPDALMPGGLEGWGEPYETGPENQLEGMSRQGNCKTYQATPNEKNRNGNVLKVLRAELLPGIAEVLKKNIGSAIGEDEGAFHELCRGSPFLASLLRTKIPGLMFLPCTSLAARAYNQG